MVAIGCDEGKYEEENTYVIKCASRLPNCNDLNAGVLSIRDGKAGWQHYMRHAECSIPCLVEKGLGQRDVKCRRVSSEAQIDEVVSPLVV